MTNQTTRPDDELLTVAQVAELLGTWKTSGERFPRRLIEERRIEYVKVGRHVRIARRVVLAYIAAHTVQPAARWSSLRAVA